jgi:CBS domain-containing protein
MHASEIMTTAPAVVTVDDTLTDAAALMRARGIGILPVVDSLVNRQLVGILTDRDIVVRSVALGHGPGARVREHMTRDPLATVHPSDALSEVAERMTRYQVRRLPVVDEHGAVIGVIAQADLARRVVPHDAALVGWVAERITRPGSLVH